MRELAGKTAFVTGGADGIGLALGRAFAEAGMKVMLADIETEALTAAVKSLHNFGPDVRGVTCDVADPASVERAATGSNRRSPDAVRGLLSAYHRGVQRGRQQMTDDSNGSPESTSGRSTPGGKEQDR